VFHRGESRSGFRSRSWQVLLRDGAEVVKVEGEHRGNGGGD
jgi:hypothetical protein